MQLNECISTYVQRMMAAARALEKPKPMADVNAKAKLYNKLLKVMPGWSDSSLASGKKFLDVLWIVLWTVSADIISVYILKKRMISFRMVDVLVASCS